MMDWEETYPYLVCGGYPVGDDYWVFFTYKGEVKIEGCNELFEFLFPLCNGCFAYNQIIEDIEQKTVLRKDEIAECIDKLLETGILVDRCKIFKAYKGYGENPMLFLQNINEDELTNLIRSPLPQDNVISYLQRKNPSHNMFATLLDSRCSTREFTDKKGIEQVDIVDIFWSSYGLQNRRDLSHTVPSGGALYPLVLYLILFEPINGMDRGFYRWYEPEATFGLLCTPNKFEIERAVDGLPSLQNAIGVMVVAADFDRIAKKYANKAYPLVLLEAGHVMQNAYLCCASKNIGFVEVMGFDQENLSSVLILDKKLEIVVLGVFGRKGE